MTEPFTFVSLKSTGYTVETLWMLRQFADKRFDAMTQRAIDQRGAKLELQTHAIAYYAASVGGLVNSWHD